MTPNQKKIAQLLASVGDFKAPELELILLIRQKYRFGTIEITTRDGVPVDILRTIERHRLGSGDELST